jgi:prepilin peptidase CpaA
MTGEYFRLGLMAILGGLLVAAAITDLRARTISNRLNSAIAVIAPFYWLACGLPVWPAMAMQLLLGGIVLIVFMASFYMGWMGGGDVKLLAALSLWFPWQAVIMLLMLMAIVGGGVTLVTVVHHRMTKRLGQPEIPYGIAISLAALWLLGSGVGPTWRTIS